MVLVCDGVTDVMSDQQVVDIVCDNLDDVEVSNSCIAALVVCALVVELQPSSFTSISPPLLLPLSRPGLNESRRILLESGKVGSKGFVQDGKQGQSHCDGGAVHMPV